MRTTFEGPAILPGYAYRLRLVSEQALFPEVARFAAQIRVSPSSDAVLAEISSTAGGFEHISDTELELALSLVGDWLDWRGPYIKPLFCPVYQGKAIQRNLSTTTVKALIKSSAHEAGLPKEIVDQFSGHSLRVGAAQDLLCAGFDTVAIMRAGGWKSVNVLSRYLEKAEHNVWA